MECDNANSSDGERDRDEMACVTVQCAYDPNWYPTGEKVSDADFNAIPLRRHDWHGDWNYDVTP